DPIDAALVPPLKRSRDVRHTLTALPALPQLSLLFRREPCPCMPLHSHTSSSAKIRRCCVDSLNSPPVSGHRARRWACPLCAKSGQTHRNKRGARACNDLRSGRSPVISLNGCYGISRRPRSFRLDVGRADHLCPLLGFFGNERPEIGR